MCPYPDFATTSCTGVREFITRLIGLFHPMGSWVVLDSLVWINMTEREMRSMYALVEGRELVGWSEEHQRVVANENIRPHASRPRLGYYIYKQRE